ncbi:hypothetical protein [Streptomyces cellostaticus]|uniref:hypothetical protein n=1 Tax=Streptomyces cellostaticus TaxID=67285 RepID=UPI00131E9B60|nr:hypothetical protein [Streptomyces cellostaticus]
MIDDAGWKTAPEIRLAGEREFSEFLRPGYVQGAGRRQAGLVDEVAVEREGTVGEFRFCACRRQRQVYVR